MRAAPAPRIRTAAVQPGTAEPSNWVMRRGGQATSIRPLLDSERRYLQGYQDWQFEARRHARTTGPARFGANIVASACSRCVLRIEEQDPEGNWIATEDPKVGRLIDEYRNDTLGQQPPELMRLHAWHYQVAGEGALVSRDNVAGQAEWWVVSLNAIHWDSPVPDFATVMMHPSGRVDQGTAFVVPSSQVIRFWTPDEEWLALAASPMTAGMEAIRRYSALLRTVKRTAESYLANNGLLWTPGAPHEAPADATGGDGASPEDDAHEDAILEQYYAAAKLAIEDDDNLEAVTPPMFWWDGEKPAWIKIGEGLDPHGKDHRDEALSDYGRALELPADLLTGGGTAHANHWSAWLVDEKFFNTAVEPTIKRVTHQDLTATFLRPRLRLMGGYEVMRYRVGFDASPVIIQPDKSDKALAMWFAGLLGAEPAREAVGFNGAQAPTPDDFKLLAKVLAKFAEGQTSGWAQPGSSGGTPHPSGGHAALPASPSNLTKGPPAGPPMRGSAMVLEDVIAASRPRVTLARNGRR